MAVKENIAALSDLKLKLPKTKEDLEKIERILKNPRLLKVVEENPDLKRVIANFVLKLKNEWEHKSMRKRKHQETKDINWLCRYISSFDCMGLLGETTVHKNKRKENQEETVVILPNPEKNSLLPNGVTKKEIIPALAQALLVAKDLKECSGQNSTHITGIKLHLDGKSLNGCHFFPPNLYQGVAEMLIKNLNQKYLEKSIRPLQKSRVIHNLDLNDCTNRKFICATFSPINTVSKIIVLKPLESRESLHCSIPLHNFAKKFLCSSTQTEERIETNSCDCSSIDSQLSLTTNQSRYDRVVEVCKKMASPSFHSYDLRRDGARNRTTEDSCTSDCVYYCNSAESTSEYKEVPFSCGASFLSSVFRHYQGPAMLTQSVGPETIIEDCRELSSINFSESCESNEIHLNNQECYEIKNHFPGHRSIMVGEDTDTYQNIQSDLEGQMPPEISTGFSELSYRNDQCYSEEGSVGSCNNNNYDILDCCSSFFVNDDGEIIPSNKEQVEDNYTDQINNVVETIVESQTKYPCCKDESVSVIPVKVNRLWLRYISKECPEFGTKNIQRPVRKIYSDLELAKKMWSTASSRGTVEENVKELGVERRRGDEASSEASSLGKDTVMDLIEKATREEGKRGQRDLVKWVHQQGFSKKLEGGDTGRRGDTIRSPRQGRKAQRKIQTVISSSSEALVRPPPPWKVRQEAKRHSKHKHKGCVIS